MTQETRHRSLAWAMRISRFVSCCPLCVADQASRRALALRTETWFEHHERVETDRLSVRMKQEPEGAWLAAASCVPFQQAPRDLDAVLGKFFARRAKVARTSTAGTTARAHPAAAGACGGRTATAGHTTVPFPFS